MRKFKFIVTKQYTDKDQDGAKARTRGSHVHIALCFGGWIIEYTIDSGMKYK